MEKANYSENEDLRTQMRTAAADGASVEFTFPDSVLVYQFPLRDWSYTGLGILTKQDSKVLDYIREGQIFSITLRRGGNNLSLETYRVEIRHISDPEQGRHPGHKVVGLHILEKETV
ncbi:hypothetical protein DO021_07460 [Desulfobacter hydrogenophilus]|uniref:PilZ domain-containing protein n=1 Tax=Desulfobacter hydrogenophilus TaxID=2291 RepID=A0A328FHQ1_9BACT|nr:hypothetical protein [Desulfobacter hydrogenophilus]NDY71888.1 hypothetical protein [Desulfobacter hydrogenophilus]QBH11977.1 hypothetical protein EYB58_02970 [Desulfobacter hydrogenophilus]RAM02663.1 hypothetical protein DO021_07460 [Desulfobacter hydrogenophilus]